MTGAIRPHTSSQYQDVGEALTSGRGRLETVWFVWKYLAGSSFFWRLHQAIRCLLVPFPRILDYLPVARDRSTPTSLLDLGCGHGVFLAMAKQRRPSLELVGLELDDEKLEAARTALERAHIPTRELAHKDIADFSASSVDCISIIDVMYLVPMEQWGPILQRAHDCLKPGGRLLLKEMDRSKSWKFRFLLLEETLAVKILGFTLGTQFNFPTTSAVRRQLEAIGFAVAAVQLDMGFPAPHLLWVCDKIAGL